MILITYHVGLDAHDPSIGYLRCQDMKTGQVFERDLDTGDDQVGLAACVAWLDGRAGAYCFAHGLDDPCFAALARWLPPRDTHRFDFPTMLAMMPEGRPLGRGWQRKVFAYWEGLTGAPLGTRTWLQDMERLESSWDTPKGLR